MVCDLRHGGHEQHNVILTQRGRAKYLCLSEPSCHWVSLSPVWDKLLCKQYYRVDGTLGNKCRWHLNQNTNIFIWSNERENIVCIMPVLLSLNVLKLLEYIQTLRHAIMKLSTATKNHSIAIHQIVMFLTTLSNRAPELAGPLLAAIYQWPPKPTLWAQLDIRS